MNKLVSVVVANYNMGKYLPMAVESILNQTYKNVEVHVVDDGSTDDSKEVMQRYADIGNVFYHYQENQGQARAKNHGILSANGDFIAFLDADDTWSHDKLEKQLPVFDTDNEIGVVYTNYKLTDKQGELMDTPSRQFHTGYISNQLFVDNFVTGMTSVIRRECLDDVGIFDEELSMGIDYDLWLRLSAHYKFMFLDEVTYFYRQWEGQMSHKHRKRFECAVKIMRKFETQYPDKLDKSVAHEAWAHLLVSQAYKHFIIENDRIGALKLFFQALKHKPGYIPAWKGLLKLCINYKKE